MTGRRLRQCALPGCDALVQQPLDDDTIRPYCSSTHRIRARRLRSLAPPDLLAAPAEPDSVWEVPVRTTLASRLAYRARRPVHLNYRFGSGRIAALRRRRTIAVLGAAAIVAAGISPVIVNRASPAAPPAPDASPSEPAQPPAEWATNAEIILTSLNQQLDTIDKTLATLSGQPQPALTAPAVTELQQHRQVVYQRHFVLQTQLNNYRVAQQVSADLAAAEGKLSAMDGELSRIPASDSPEQADLARQLAEQRKTQRDLRDAQRNTLSTLNNSVGQAVATPLLDVTDHTTSLIDRALTNGKQPGRPPTGQQVPPPPAVLPRQVPPAERKDTSNGGPPNRRSPGLRPNLGTDDEDSSETRADSASPASSADTGSLDSASLTTPSSDETPDSTSMTFDEYVMARNLEAYQTQLALERYFGQSAYSSSGRSRGYDNSRWSSGRGRHDHGGWRSSRRGGW